MPVISLRRRKRNKGKKADVDMAETREHVATNDTEQEAGLPLGPQLLYHKNGKRILGIVDTRVMQFDAVRKGDVDSSILEPDFAYDRDRDRIIWKTAPTFPTDVSSASASDAAPNPEG
jgi:hypothetical protein